MNEAVEIIREVPLSESASTRFVPELRDHKGERTRTRSSVAALTFQPDAELISLVHQVFLRKREVPLRTVVFCGLDSGVGCSRIAASTAAMLAAEGELVCLLEANFATRSLARLFGVDGSPGLAEALQDEATPILRYTQSVSKDDRLWLLPAGHPGAGADSLLAGRRLQARISALQQEFAFVIVDAPSMQHAETLAIGRAASGLILVLEADRTRRDSTAAAAAKLKSSEIELLGAVLNKRKFPIPSQLYERL